LPILERILRQKLAKQAQNKPLDKSNVVGTLILVPTRELAIQIREEFEKFSAHIENKVKCLSVFGGVKINPQMIAFTRWCRCFSCDTRTFVRFRTQ